MLTGIFSDSDSEDPSPANSVGPVRGSCIPHCERDVSFISIASLAEPDIELFRVVPVALVRKFELEKSSFKYSHTDTIISLKTASGRAPVLLEALEVLLDMEKTYIFRFFPVSLQITKTMFEDKPQKFEWLKKLIFYFYPNVKECNNLPRNTSALFGDT